MKTVTYLLMRAVVVVALIAGAYLAGGVVAPLINPDDAQATTAPCDGGRCYEQGCGDYDEGTP